MKTKLHLGCGPVYLYPNFINIDVEAPNHFLAKDRPDLVEDNITTLDKYYKNRRVRSDFESGAYHKEECVVDLYADVRNLPFEENSVDEIRSYQLFEHFTFKEGEELLEHWKKVLKPNGRLFIDIPDLKETISGYYASRSNLDRKWFRRLLYGSQKDQWGVHKGMYSVDDMTELLAKHGFKFISVGPNIHEYPAFSIEGVK